ncbi:MAG: DEAD/DEAH box helicase [Peptococcaceae bacterium]|jgi:ATP-dependent RNA helicase DeaD|nr:DEAD/DEAH box helicase [Peptococcaceae bacterium]
MFGELAVSKKVAQALSEMGFEEPTPIQAQAVPLIMQGQDVIGQAQTGTGKTAAFGIPIIEHISAGSPSVQALIMTPTRELAVQVAEEINRIGHNKKIKVLPVYGGQPIDRQLRSLRMGVHVVIGTPGRVLDHLDRRSLKLGSVKTVVLDEADEMLDMGFVDDIESILQQVPDPHQTLLFSATMPEPIRVLSRKYLKSPEFISINRETLTVPQTQQFYYEVTHGSKAETLCRILDYENYESCIVFCRTKRGVDELVATLQTRGYDAEGLHGDLTQAQRDKTMKKIRQGDVDILVATDVAARGLDIERVSHVINYDIPQDPESYVHRIGRTGRAGREGVALTLIIPQEYKHLRLIEKLIRSRIQRATPPTFQEILEQQKQMVHKQIEDILREGKLDAYREIAKELLEFFDQEDALAAVLKHTFESRGIELVDNPSSYRNTDLGNTGAKPGMVRLFFTVGRQQNIRPGDLVKIISQEANISGRDIGSINIYEKFTFLEVPEDQAYRVLHTMDRYSLNGRRISVQLARARQ